MARPALTRVTVGTSGARATVGATGSRLYLTSPKSPQYGRMQPPWSVRRKVTLT